MGNQRPDIARDNPNLSLPCPLRWSSTANPRLSLAPTKGLEQFGIYPVSRGTSHHTQILSTTQVAKAAATSSNTTPRPPRYF